MFGLIFLSSTADYVFGTIDFDQSIWSVLPLLVIDFVQHLPLHIGVAWTRHRPGFWSYLISIRVWLLLMIYWFEFSLIYDTASEMTPYHNTRSFFKNTVFKGITNRKTNSSSKAIIKYKCNGIPEQHLMYRAIKYKCNGIFEQHL